MPTESAAPSECFDGAFTSVDPIGLDFTPPGSRCGDPAARGSSALRRLVTPRQRDKRRALSDLLSALTRSLDRQLDISVLRGEFEDALRRIVPVRSVQLRDTGTRDVPMESAVESSVGSAVGAAAGAAVESAVESAVEAAVESIALDVPAADATLGGQLEATFDPGCCLGEWDFQVLSAAADVGALVLEIERLRLQLARAGLMPSVRWRRTAAAPLVGSTPVMHELRAAIQRVAATDFTVLL